MCGEEGMCMVKGGCSCQRGACMAKGCVHGQGGMCGRGYGGCAWQEDVHGREHAWHRGGMCGKGGGAYVAEESATAADGTHPTGMNSCFLFNMPNRNLVYWIVLKRNILDLRKTYAIYLVVTYPK